MSPRVRKGLRIFSLSFLVIIIAFAAYIWWPNTPHLDAYKNLGKNYDVRILRDTWGVPHIFGKTDADAAFGLAYAHSEDDFRTIQQTALAARGILATVYGKDAAANDYMVQLLKIWDVVNSKYETDLAPDSRAVFEAYASGLNYYAALHPDEVLNPDLFPLTGKDLVAASVHKSPLFFGLEKVLGQLFSDNPTGIPDPTPTAFNYFDQSFDVLYGSNTFAVGPSRTSDGSTYLDVNSHQPWEGPVSWYEAHVHSDEGWDAVGALFPGVPSIVHGHNKNLGWAFTVNDADLVDIYTLEINPQNKNQYKYDGQWRDLEVWQAPIRVKLYGNLIITVKQEVLRSVYGPVARRPTGTYAIRYSGFGRVDIFQQLYRMNKASNFQEWQDAMRNGGLPTFNVGYADKDGNIYYLYNAMLPLRKEGYDWSKFLPGNTSDTLWNGYLPFDKLPQVLNPPSGFIQNANSTPYQTTTGPGNPDPKDFSPVYGIETWMTNRAQRLLEQLNADSSITFDEFKQYKFDQTYSSKSDMALWRQYILDMPATSDPDIQQAVELVRNWDLKDDPQSKGATLMVLAYTYLKQNKYVMDGSLMGQDIAPEAVYLCFKQVVELLKTKFGGVDIAWERVNRLVRGNVNLGLGGGPDVVNAVYGKLQDDGTLKGYQGDSYVMLIRWDPQGQVESYSIHQYGSATLHPESPHYADQAQLFVKRQLKPVWFDEATIREHLEKEYRPGEELQQ